MRHRSLHVAQHCTNDQDPATVERLAHRCDVPFPFPELINLIRESAAVLWGASSLQTKSRIHPEMTNPNSPASQWRVRPACLTSSKVFHTTIGITALHFHKGLLHDDPIQTPIQCRWGFTQGASGIWPAICEPTPNVLFAGRFTRSCAVLFDPRVCSFAPGANMRRTIAAQYIL